MSTVSDPTTQQSVREKISRLSPAELEAVDRLLELLEIKRLRRSVGEAVDAAFAAGLMNDVDTAIREHRARHPYS